MDVKIGGRLRNLRLARNLTQEEVAERADLSVGFISTLERDQTSISVDALLNILAVLNVKIADFFQEAIPDQIIYPASDRTAIADTGASKFELLIPGGADRKMEAALVQLRSGESTYPMKPFQGEAFGFVLAGAISLQFGAERHKAIKGQSFYFSGDREHIISNDYERAAEFIWVTTPPTF